MNILGGVLNLDLKCEGIEMPVGSFKADIICEEVHLKQRVLIENQLTATDHTHLGQLITYSAGIDASTVIWIAEKFTEEHRAALEKLNKDSSQGVNYFGIELELVKIDDSLPAPRFNIIVQPNDWSRTVSAAIKRSDLSQMQKMQYEYWGAFYKSLEGEKNLSIPNPQPKNFMNFKIGKSFVSISTKIISEEDSICVELCLSGEFAKKNYNILFERKEKIELQLKESLDWIEHPENGPHKIMIKLSEAGIFDKKDWKRQQDWLKQYLFQFCKIFRPLCKGLITNQ